MEHSTVSLNPSNLLAQLPSRSTELLIQGVAMAELRQAKRALMSEQRSNNFTNPLKVNQILSEQKRSNNLTYRDRSTKFCQQPHLPRQVNQILSEQRDSTTSLTALC